MRVDRETDRDADRLSQLAGRLLVQQSVYAGGETVASTRRAENLVLSGRSRLADAEQTVLLEGVEAYAGVVRALAVLGYSPNEFLMRMSRAEIGNYLGMTLETVSRLFSRLARDGLIEVHQRSVRILDMDALNQRLEQEG